MGKPLIEDEKERENLARLNCKAGKKSKLATAFISALKYAQKGIKLLSDNAWQQQYELSLELHRLVAEAAYSAGEFEIGLNFIEVALELAQNSFDKVRFCQIKIDIYVARKQACEAVEVGRKILAALGIELPNSLTPEETQQIFTKAEASIPKGGIEALLALPISTDPTVVAMMETLVGLSTPIFTSNPALFPLLFANLLDQTLKHGTTAFSAVGYSHYSILLCNVFNDLEAAYQFGQLALKLLPRFHNKIVDTQVLCIAGCATHHWKIHLRETLPFYQKGALAALEVGDLLNLGWNYVHESYTTYLLGMGLSETAKQVGIRNDVLRKGKQENHLFYNETLMQCILNLQNLTENPYHLRVNSLDEEELVARVKGRKDTVGLFLFYFCKLQLCYVLNRYELAVKYANLTLEYSAIASSYPSIPVMHFYIALTHLALGNYSREDCQILEKVQVQYAKLESWSRYGPMNCQHKFLLLEAEKQRVLDNKAVAIEFYDRAIAGAKENEYIQEEALANELAAKFYLDWGKEKVAAGYMTDAYYCYARWGAKAKTDQLEKKYPQLLVPILQQPRLQFASAETATSTLTSTLMQTAAPSNSKTDFMLDWTTAMKAAQSLSSEMHLDKLVSALMKAAMENAGADGGILVLQQPSGWQIAAQCSVDVCSSEPTEGGIPTSVINQVKHSQKTIIVNDFASNTQFTGDPYLLQGQPLSFLCAPILNQGKLIGILYLENHLAVGVFTTDRILIVNFLCTQAAISLENARLYKVSQEKLRLLALRMSIDSTLTQEKTLKEMFRRCTEIIVDHLKVAFARIWTLNESERVLELQASAGLYTHINGAHSVVPVGHLKIGAIAQERLPHLTNDVLTDPRVSDKDWARQEGMVAFAGYPLMVGDRLLGVMAMFAREPLNPNVLDSLRFIADEIARGIERQQMMEALQISEASLKLKAQALEQLLQDLKQAQLQTIQNEKMAALGNLVAGIAHEINNPVGFIAGNLEPARYYLEDLFRLIDLYQQKYPDPDAEIEAEIEAIDLEFLRSDLPQLISSMREGTERICHISTSLRTFSRTDKEHKVAFDIHQGIESTLLILKHRLKSNEERPAIEIVKDYGDLPEVQCFPGQLNQVFMNLIANAIDALESASEGRSFDEIAANPNRIVIKTEATEEEVTVSIIDNGTGMSEEVKQRIFEQGFTTKAVGKGTGLGMAIALSIVAEKHGGAIACHGELGKGTEFIISLPLS